MASRPPEPPESIILGNFKGVRNTVARHRLQPEELEAAINVDIDDTGQVRRRRGYSLKLAGNFHSVRNVGGRILGVKDGLLGTVGTNFTFASLGAPGGAEPLSYAQVGGVTYFSSLDVSGKLEDGVVSPWGAVSNDVWVSPVITPTETLGELFGQQLTAPPSAQEIASYKGRLYLAAGRYLWCTELWLYDYIDPSKNFYQFEEDITLLVAMDDGIFVGTEANLWFLNGAPSTGMTRANVLKYGVVRGSATSAPAADVHPNARGGALAESISTIFLTQKGVCAGFNGGEVYDLTRARVEFPLAQSAAVLYREDSGVSSFVAVTDSAGGSTANARIGDFVDAEIVRRGG